MATRPQSRSYVELVIADKNPVIQTGLRHIFEEDERFRVVAVATDGERFLEAVQQLSFQIGIIGWEMPYLGGRNVLARLRDMEGGPRIIVYTGSADPNVPNLVMALGGAGFCLKSEPPETLVDTVLAVASGRMVFPFTDIRELQNNPLSNLTPRETHLLAALADGQSNAQLAKDFNISPNTVKFHLKNLYEKLEVSSRTEAVVKYLRKS